ncbi:MAG: glycosyltransferase [Armatimonadota bacterium]
MVKGLVSVVISSYNHAQFIAQCIDSVLAQDYPQIEVIVVDDGSSDQSVEILKSYGGKIRLECQKTGGTYGALNRGIRLAQGEFIAILNSDDYWEAGKLSAQVAAMRANPQATAAHTGGGFVDANCQKVDQNPFGFDWPSPPSGNIMTNLIRANCMIASSVMMRGSTLKEVGLFEPRLFGSGDWHMWLRLATVGDIEFVPAEYTRYRIHGANASRQRRHVFDDETWIRESAIRKNEARLISTAADPKEMKIALIHSEACLAGAHEILGHRKTAMGIWARNWLRYPLRMKSLYRLIRCVFSKPKRIPIV